MLVRGNLLPVKRKHLGRLLLLTAISIICVAFSMTGSDNLDIARREILLRRIGHEILLQSGDSTSRVLPVKKIADNEYQSSFENAFTFQPDSLVHTTRLVLANDPLAGDYVVNVLNGGDSSVAYGYAISGNKKDDIIACLGRAQPPSRYLINIQFGPKGLISAKNGYLLGGLSVLALVGAILLWLPKQRSVLPENGSAIPGDNSAGLQTPSTNRFTLGSMSFDAETHKLRIDEKTIDLTKTESRVLRIFAASPNEAIERSRLQKEIWEDEGVIVGRSLDMFISKLRKKLEPDPTIRLAVIRGKGYRLEINA
jgi:DNA-binding winged helix-turn-helix (wHTH) protein